MNFEEQPPSVEIIKPIPQEKEKFLTAEEITRMFLHLESLREKLPGEDPKLQLIISIWLDRKSYRDSVRKQEDKYRKEKNSAGENKLVYIDILRRLILRKSPLAREAIGLAYNHLNAIINETAGRLKSLLVMGKESGEIEKTREAISFEKKFLSKVSELRKDLERLISINYPELMRRIKTKTIPEVETAAAKNISQSVTESPLEPDKQQAEAKPGIESKTKEQEEMIKEREKTIKELEREDRLLGLGFVKSTGRDYVLYNQLEKDYGWNDGLGMAKKKFEPPGVKVEYPDEAQARQILTGLARDLLIGYSIGCYLEDQGKFMLATNTEKGLVFRVRDVFNLGNVPEYHNSDESLVPIKVFVVGR